MSSINAHPTLNYSQPEAYHFSHDSVFLARTVFEQVAHRVRPDLTMLDLCAGCGIVGMDFLFHCRWELNVTPSRCDFVEVQQEYAEHFLENVKCLNETSCALNFIAENYSSLIQDQFKGKYDLILCNPPYFRLGQGKLSPSIFKNRCRFFMDSDFATLLTVIVHLLKPGGEAYVLLRGLDDHGLNPLEEAWALLANTGVRLEIVGDIRGTGLLRISPPG